MLCISTRVSWFFVWVSEWCSRAALASIAALRSLSRRSASSWAIVLSLSNSSALRVCSSSSEKNHLHIHKTSATHTPIQHSRTWCKPYSHPEITSVLIYQAILLMFFNGKKTTQEKFVFRKQSDHPELSLSAPQSVSVSPSAPWSHEQSSLFPSRQILAFFSHSRAEPWQGELCINTHSQKLLSPDSSF